MIKGKTVGVVLAAAGSGTRMGMDCPKQFLPVGGVPMLIKTLHVFVEAKVIDTVTIVCAKEQQRRVEEMLAEYGLSVDAIVSGGKERQDSSEAGVMATSADIVLIHDAARPFVTERVIEDVARLAEETGAAICAVPVKDTIRTKEKTLDRSSLFSVQTPQGFDRALLLKAFEHARKNEFRGTDDAGLVEEFGHPVAIAEGSYENIKITTKEDLPVETRTGIGFDVHVLTEGRKLILGGVTIPYEKGLLGHSDADVLVHAVMDAILSAAGLGDIGHHFPDTDPAYEGADSLALLRHTKDLVARKGYTIVNIGATLIAQKPKVAPYIEAMQKNIAEAAEVKTEQINVAATTTEKLGFAGRGEGMAAQAVCTLKTR